MVQVISMRKVGWPDVERMGRFIRVNRELLNMTRKEFIESAKRMPQAKAQDWRMTETTLWKLETGQTSYPRFQTVVMPLTFILSKMNMRLDLHEGRRLEKVA